MDESFAESWNLYLLPSARAALCALVHLDPAPIVSQNWRQLGPQTRERLICAFSLGAQLGYECAHALKQAQERYESARLIA